MTLLRRPEPGGGGKGDRHQQRAQPQDEQEVDQVGADDVADRERGAPVACRVDPDGELGELVPIETTVRPTSIGGIPSLAARPVPRRTRTSAPASKAASPPTTSSTATSYPRCDDP
jgi:hypothetical protein